MAGFEHCKLKSTLPRLVQQPFLPTSEPPRRFGRSLISFASRFAIQQMQPAWCSSHLSEINLMMNSQVLSDKKEILTNSNIKSYTELKEILFLKNYHELIILVSFHLTFFPHSFLQFFSSFASSSAHGYLSLLLVYTSYIFFTHFLRPGSPTSLRLVPRSGCCGIIRWLKHSSPTLKTSIHSFTL